MGQCVCKDRQSQNAGGSESYGGGVATRGSENSGFRSNRGRLSSMLSTSANRRGGGDLSNSVSSSRENSGSFNHNQINAHLRALTLSDTSNYRNQLIQTVNIDIEDLIRETLDVIRILVNNEQEPPAAMLKLHIIAEHQTGWIMIVQRMIDIVPMDNPLGAAVITLFLDESPLPTKDTVARLLFFLNLNDSTDKSNQWHRNACIVLGCIAEKLAGPNCVATFKPQTLQYLLSCLDVTCDPNVILFALIALEKYAQTSENKMLIARKLKECEPNHLHLLEHWLEDGMNFQKRQVGFCAQWCLDNLFFKENRRFAYEIVDTTNINVMLNRQDVSEYLKISPSGLEARCDVSSFESVRSTFQVVGGGIWYYEALIITSGVMQIGWATKESKFLNHDGFGIGDDDTSVAYDGCRQLMWHDAVCVPYLSTPLWKPGDILGCLLDLDAKKAIFYLNGVMVGEPHQTVFDHSHTGYFAAASFMSFQQCEFNFGASPFRYAPQFDVAVTSTSSSTVPAPLLFRSFNAFGMLSEEQRIIIPKYKKLAMLREASVPENSCMVCCDNIESMVLKPCGHTGFCSNCALQLEQCPYCRCDIEERCTVPESGDVISDVTKISNTIPGDQNENCLPDAYKDGSKVIVGSKQSSDSISGARLKCERVRNDAQSEITIVDA